jgi:hypothetical protein
LLAASVVLSPYAARSDPRTDYMLHCRGCHGPDGGGNAGGVPSFRGEVGKFLSVPGGREYLIRVPGTAQSELSDARTAALLNWLVEELSPDQVPPDFEPYTEVEVARYRKPLVDVGRVRRRLLGEIESAAKSTIFNRQAPNNPQWPSSKPPRFGSF